MDAWINLTTTLYTEGGICQMGKAAGTTNDGGRGFGFLFEMGCGKTLTAIAALGALYNLGKASTCLVIAPTTVASVWKKELSEKADFDFEVVVLLGSKAQRVQKINEMIREETPAMKIITINYNEIFRSVIYEKLLEFHADVIILDEAHYIKNHTSQTSKAAFNLGKAAKYRMLLTGTPITNKSTDIFGEFLFLDQNIFGKNFYAFRNKYCVMGGYQNKVIIRDQNRDDLIQKMHSIALRVTKADALDLPEETTEVRYVTLGKTERDIYEQLRKNGLAELSNGEVKATMVITKLLRLQQVTGGFVQADDAERPMQIGSSKLDALMEIINDVVVECGEKLVIFARFIPEVEAICGMLNVSAIKYGCIYGAIPQEERGSIVDDFQTNDATKVFVAQIQTAGLGITLHAASTAVFYSKDFSYSNVSQAMARIHRIGQRHPCTYIDLIAEGTVDEKIQAAIASKRDLSDGICDHWREYF